MAIASISGTALAPGVSRNQRLYTPEIIAKAAKRMQDRIANPDALPIVMRSHHDAGDDSTRIVGRVTSVKVGSDNKLRYTAELFNTQHGRDIAALVKPEEGKPGLRSVSIHGYWVGDTKRVQTAEGMATTADDLEIDAIDFTATPGVEAAVIDGESGAPVESGGVLRTPIRESAEADVTFTDDDTGWAVVPVAKSWHLARGVQYEGDAYRLTEAKYSADDKKAMLAKGHAMKNADGEPSYPIADVSDLKKAIRAVGRGGASHNAVRKHIIKRAKALGQPDLIPDNWNSDGTMKESTIRLSEIREYYPEGPDGGAAFCIDAYAGPLSVTVRGCVPPDQLRTAAMMATTAAMNAVQAMDPDADGDIDTGMEAETQPSGAVSPDDDMADKYSESALRKALEAMISGAPLNDRELRTAVGQLLAEGATSADPTEATVDVTVEGSLMDENKLREMITTMLAEHDAQLAKTTEAAPADSTTEEASPSDETETAPINKEESAMGDTQDKAAEAAPATAITAADLAAFGTTIAESVGDKLAEALRAFAEMNTPKHAAAPQETTEKAEDVAESAPSATLKADDLTALKESLANELRKEIRNDLRAELLVEKGLPPRRGYRLSENDEPEEMTDAELFNNHRVDMLLGDYASVLPAADASQAV